MDNGQHIDRMYAESCSPLFLDDIANLRRSRRLFEFLLCILCNLGARRLGHRLRGTGTSIIDSSSFVGIPLLSWGVSNGKGLI